MSLAIKPYLQLVRLPNVFTAPADSLAGWLLAGGSLATLGQWLPLGLASMTIYAAGIALNDVFDYEIDKVERPRRPLPSGQVSLRFAIGLSLICLFTGWTAAVLGGGVMGGAVAGTLILAVLLYNVRAKHTSFGPWVMGLCRSLNLLLGFSLAPMLGGPVAWTAAVGTWLFVAGFTWISRWEAESGKRQGIALGWPLQMVGLLLTATAIGLIPPLNFWHVMGWLVLIGVCGSIVNANSQAWKEPIPAKMQACVKTAVLSLIWINTALVLGGRGPFEALAVAVLWIPAFLLARWLYST